jgi:hypothetical protein
VRGGSELGQEIPRRVGGREVAQVSPDAELAAVPGQDYRAQAGPPAHLGDGVPQATGHGQVHRVAAIRAGQPNHGYPALHLDGDHAVRGSRSRHRPKSRPMISFMISVVPP